MNRAALTRWLRAPQVTGASAILCAAFAVACPTAVRAAVNGTVTGCEFTPYLPFVLVSAILMRWGYAALVAIASIAILGGLFEGSGASLLPCFISASGMFVGASAVIITLAVLMRWALSAEQAGAGRASGNVIFSIDRGEVWATWRGQRSPLSLGPRREVTRTMESFLDHAEPRNGAGED
jgi:hypothetical protein